MGRNINSILKNVSFSNLLSSCCRWVLWGKKSLVFWVCLHFLIYTKPILCFPIFLPATHRALSYHVHFSLFLCLLLLLSVSVQCYGGRKWLYFPRQQVLIFVVATQTWQSLSRIQRLSQEIWKSCSPLARNLLFLRQTAAATPELWHGETLGCSSLFHFPVPSTSRVFILYITSLFSFSWKSFVCWVPPSLLSNPCASLKGLS